MESLQASQPQSGCEGEFLANQDSTRGSDNQKGAPEARPVPAAQVAPGLWSRPALGRLPTPRFPTVLMPAPV